MPPRQRKTPLRAVGPTEKAPAKPRATALERKVKTALQSQQLVELIASGLTEREAADRLKMVPSRASKLLNDQLAAHLAQNNERRELLVTQDLETVRLLMKAHMPMALRGDEKSARIVLGCLDKRGKLLGLDAEIKIQISNQRIDETVSEVVKMLEAGPDDLPRLLETDIFVITDAEPPRTEAAGE
jgi:hypothetical protein